MNHVPDVQMSSHLAALRGLFLVALHHGVQVPPERFAGADEADTVGSLLRLMRDIGVITRIFDDGGKSRIARQFRFSQCKKWTLAAGE